MMSRDAATDRSLLDALLDLRRRRATGALEVEVQGQIRHLYLRDGELHLPGSHPLARHLSERLAAQHGGSKAGAGGEPLLDTVARIGELLAAWKSCKRQFREGAGALPAHLVGPMPTARLLMLAATAGIDDPAIEQHLDETGERYVALKGAEALTDDLGYTPEEAFLLERLRLPMSVAELLADSPIPRAELLRRLFQLTALGAVRRESAAAGARASAGQEEAEIVASFAARIERGLEERPLELPAAEHRARLADLLSRHGALDHYELLGLSPSASAGQVQAAFEELARIVHPVHAARLGLGERRAAFELLFERAAAAYSTLMDPERRRAYNVRQLIEVPSLVPTGAQRVTERQDLARSQYERALAYANAGDVHSAVSLLEQVVLTDPRGEYWVALGRQQSRNSSWLGRAAASFKEAILLDADDVDAHFGLGEVYERQGELERARVQFSAVLRSSPRHFAATERLARLGELAAASPNPGAGGLLSRFFRRE